MTKEEKLAALYEKGQKYFTKEVYENYKGLPVSGAVIELSADCDIVQVREDIVGLAAAEINKIQRGECYDLLVCLKHRGEIDTSIKARARRELAMQEYHDYVTEILDLEKEIKCEKSEIYKNLKPEDVNIVDIIRCKIELKEKLPGKYTALCPLHKEKTPSFTVNELEQTYHCFGCGSKGNYHDFIKAYREKERIEEFKTGEFYATPKLLDVVETKEKEIISEQDKIKNLLEKLLKTLEQNKTALDENAKLKEEIVASIKECNAH